MSAVIETSRLALRPRKPDDAERIVALIGERDVARMLSSVPYPYTVADAREWLSGALGQAEDAVFVLDDGGGAIGVASLNYVEPGTRRLGFWVGKPYWGKGYMSEAAGALVDWGFGSGDLMRIESGAFVDNGASRRIHAKLGFRETGPIVLHSPARGRSDPAVAFALDRATWEAGR